MDVGKKLEIKILKELESISVFLAVGVDSNPPPPVV